MSVKRYKKLNDEKLAEERNRAGAEWDLLNSKNAIAMRKDIDTRFNQYNEDPSIGNMYQRKKKPSKSKTKCSCKKNK